MVAAAGPADSTPRGPTIDASTLVVAATGPTDSTPQGGGPPSTSPFFQTLFYFL
jgi:hypothetical protein